MGGSVSGNMSIIIIFTFTEGWGALDAGRPRVNAPLFPLLAPRPPPALVMPPVAK